MLKNRVFYGVMLVIAALIYIFTNTYYTLTLLLACILLPLISFVLMLFSRNGLTVRLELPAMAEKETAVLAYELSNTSFFPAARVAFVVELENQMTGTGFQRKINATVGGHKKVDARLSLQNSKVGCIRVSTRKIRVYDIFGLFTLKKKDLQDQMMVIYPDLKDISVSMEKPVETQGDGERYAVNRPGQDVSEIFQLREYTPGDEVRKIHWKLSSKIDRMMVRDFSLPLNYSVFLLMELTETSEDIIDTEVELYLSLSKALLENGINHNLAWYDSGEEAFHARTMDDFEDLEIAMAEILSSYPSKQQDVALEYYMTSAYKNQRSILLYVTSDPVLDKIAEVEMVQRVHTILVYEKEEIKTNAEQLIEVMSAQVGSPFPEIIV